MSLKKIETNLNRSSVREVGEFDRVKNLTPRLEVGGGVIFYLVYSNFPQSEHDGSNDKTGAVVDNKSPPNKTSYLRFEVIDEQELLTLLFTKP